MPHQDTTAQCFSVGTHTCAMSPPSGTGLCRPRGDRLKIADGEWCTPKHDENDDEKEAPVRPSPTVPLLPLLYIESCTGDGEWPRGDPAGVVNRECSGLLWYDCGAERTPPRTCVVPIVDVSAPEVPSRPRRSSGSAGSSTTVTPRGCRCRAVGSALPFRRSVRGRAADCARPGDGSPVLPSLGEDAAAALTALMGECKAARPLALAPRLTPLTGPSATALERALGSSCGYGRDDRSDSVISPVPSPLLPDW